MKKVFLLPGILIFFLACERADEPVIDTTPKFSVIQSQILNLNCAVSGCHIGATPPQGLNMEEGNAYGNLVNVSSMEQPLLDRIEPGSPEESYLYLKITGNASISGSQMPLGRSPLSKEQMDLIRDWILEGAQNN